MYQSVIVRENWPLVTPTVSHAPKPELYQFFFKLVCTHDNGYVGKTL